MPRSHTIRFKIEGDNVRPETVPLKDLAAAALMLERAVRHNCSKDPLALPEDEELHLTNVSEGSLALELEGSQRIINSAWAIQVAIGNADLSVLDARTRRAIEKLADFGRVRGWTYAIESIDAYVRFSSATLPSAVPIKSRTSICGYLVRVGGKDPRALLKTPRGEVPVVLADAAMATELGRRLYEWIELYGDATYDARDWSIQKFVATSIGSFRQMPAQDAFDELARSRAGVRFHAA